MSSFSERLAAAKKARVDSRRDNRSEAAAEAARLAGGRAAEVAAARAEAAAAAAAQPVRQQMLQQSAASAERVQKAVARNRAKADTGFSSYEEATARQHARLTSQLVPVSRDSYERQLKRCGPAFYGSAGTVLPAANDTKEAVDKMVQDLEQQIAKRQKYSRRRTHNDDADIDYINERNAKFNKKLERFYGEHTAEIKQNLERGTAI